jgi:hypothetical protein
MRKSNSDPVGTLSVGNVVSTAVTLYKSNFSSYCLVSLRSVGWIFLAMVAYVVTALIVALLANTIGTGLSIFLGIAMILTSLAFCLGKSAVDRAIISRMAYQQLINQPETIQSATQKLSGYQWRFFRLSAWLLLFLIGVEILAYVCLLTVTLIGTYLGSQISGVVGGLLSIILTLAGLVSSILIVVRFCSSWFVAELPLAVDGYTAALDSIGRSSHLSRSFIMRIIFVIIVSALITWPLYMLASTPLMIFYAKLFELIQLDPSMSSPAAYTALYAYALLPLLSLIFILLLSIVIMPFWQTVKSVLYFDLCSRREGNDLLLR